MKQNKSRIILYKTYYMYIDRYKKLLISTIHVKQDYFS